MTTRTTARRSAALLVLSLPTAQVAHASTAHCKPGDAPVAYENQLCNGICTHNTSTDTVTCDIDDSGASTSASGSILAATAYGSSTADFSVWGHDDAGDIYCCTVYESGDEVTNVHLYGGDGDDLIKTVGSGWSLADPGGTASFDVLVRGHTGDDDIDGPSSASIDVCTLEGGPGNDTLSMGIACTANGNLGADTITGSASGDGIYGDESGDPNGVADGGDVASGGSGNDTMHGGGGADSFCGDGGNDTLLGGAGNSDKMWGGAGASDVAHGGSGTSDQCKAETQGSTCESTLWVKPGACP